jgi:phosphate butyryltransferase
VKNIKELITLSKHISKFRMVVSHAQDEAVLEAVNQVLMLDLCIPILVGDKKEIISILQQKGYDQKKYTIIHSDSDFESAQIAVKFIKENKADVLMKGLLETKVLLKAVVDKTSGIKDKPLLSHVAILSYPNKDKVLFATDCAMVPNPTIEDKKSIIENAVSLTTTLGYKMTKIGLVSSVEKPNPTIPSSLEAQELKQYYQGLNPQNYMVDGPFAIDNLVSKEAALTKKINSIVAGDADILVFPNIDSGNIFYKTSVFLAQAEVAGIIIGAKAPIVLTSRADSSISKLYSILLAGVYQNGLQTINH